LVAERGREQREERGTKIRHAEEITMMYPYGEHMSGWGYALGITGMVLFWVVLVLAIAAAVRYLDRKRGENFPPPPPPRPPTADQVLAERFARGEIDAEEYRQRLDTLRQAGRSAPLGAR
jgi:putative membrane protein